LLDECLNPGLDRGVDVFGMSGGGHRLLRPCGVELPTASTLKRKPPSGPTRTDVEDPVGEEPALRSILSHRPRSGNSLAVPRRAPPPSALKSASPVLKNPANRNRAVPLTYDQFRFGFANAVSEDEAKELYHTFAVPASGEPLFQAASANLNPWTEAKANSKNPERGRC